MEETVMDLCAKIRTMPPASGMRTLGGEECVECMPFDINWDKIADSFEKAYKREVAALEADRDNWRKQALAEDERANASTVGKEDWSVVRAVADEMLNMSMHDIDAEHIYGWAVRIGELASKHTKGETK